MSIYLLEKNFGKPHPSLIFFALSISNFTILNWSQHVNTIVELNLVLQSLHSTQTVTRSNLPLPTTGWELLTRSMANWITEADQLIWPNMIIILLEDFVLEDVHNRLNNAHGFVSYGVTCCTGLVMKYTSSVCNVNNGRISVWRYELRGYGWR